MNCMLFIKRINNKVKNIVNIMIWKMCYGRKLVLHKPVFFRKAMTINIAQEGRIEIGKNTFFNNYCSLNSHGSIDIGNDCLFGENVKVYDHNHIFNTYKKIQEEKYKVGNIVIGNNCWIGSNVLILKNAKIGDNCTIAAGCVINEEIPSNSIVKLNHSNQIIEQIKRN